MSDFENLCSNDYCKYHNIHLIGYNITVKLKLQTYCKFIPQVITCTKTDHVSTQTEVNFIAPAYSYTK